MTVIKSTAGRKTVLASLITALTLATFAMINPSSTLAQEDNALIVEADDSLQWLRNERKYIATGNATANQGDLTLDANVITAYYEAENTAEGDHDASAITFIRGEKAAKLVRATLTATADVIEYDVMSEFVKIFGGSPLIVNGRDTLSASDTITYDRISRQIIATGAAKIKMANGQQLRGNVITVVITKDEGDIKTVTAQGKALVISLSENGEHRADADKMFYTNSDGLAILTGNVKVQNGNNILTGDRAEIDTVTGTSTMSSTENGQRVSGVFKPAQ